MVHAINLGIYLLYLLFLTMYITSLDPMMHTDGYKVLNLTTGEYMELDSPRAYFPVSNLFCVLFSLMAN